MKCVLCGEEITPEPITGWEYGCNPYPLADHGRCCHDCDTRRVFPARIAEYERNKRNHNKATPANGKAVR